MENPAIKFNQSDLPADGKRELQFYKEPGFTNCIIGACCCNYSIYLEEDVQKNSQIALVEKRL